MAMVLVGEVGYVLEVAVRELLRAVIDAKPKAASFQSSLELLEITLKRLEFRLRYLIPRLDQNSLLNHLQQREMEKLVAILHNGMSLVHKCSKISALNLIIKKGKYSNELFDLNNNLKRYFVNDQLSLMECISEKTHMDDEENDEAIVEREEALNVPSRDQLSILERNLEKIHMGDDDDEENEEAIVEREEELNDVGLSSSSIMERISEKIHMGDDDDEENDEAIVEREEELNDVGLSSSSSSSMVVVPVYSSRISPKGKFNFRQFSIKSWQKGAFLGSGSFGTVYKGYTDNGLFLAVKEVSLLDKGSQGQQSILQLEQEISLLSQFEHENIVQYFGTAKDEARLYIFLELVTEGSLLSLYVNYTLRDSQASLYTRQILNGLKYLHERNVVHRDIKCANILVHASGSVKLADFGLAKATISNDIKSCKGTAFWMAPEVVRSKENGYGLAADIWSLGCTVLEMLTGQHPYSNLEWMEAAYTIGQGEPPLVPNSLSLDVRDFIHKCLQVNPDNRPTAAQLLEHSFIKRSTASKLINQELSL